MSEKFEQSIIEWYSNSRAYSLEYLNLAVKPKPTTVELANNLEVIYNRVSLLSKVSLKHFHHLREENQELKQEISQLRATVSHLEQEVVKQKPLTKREVLGLVREITQQPKLVEEQALKLTEELKKSVCKVERLIAEVKILLGG